MNVTEQSAAKLSGAGGYMNSHKTPGKGEEYDAYYETSREMHYLWQQEQWVLLRILQDCFGDAPVRLLDFACGTGRIAAFLESRVRSSDAVDISESMLQVARRKLVGTRVHNVNLTEECPFPAGSFDVITAFRFFLNAEPELRKAVLAALAPLLSPGGHLVFNVHQNQHSFYYQSVRLYCRMRAMTPCVTLSVGECERLLSEVGLELVRAYPVGLLHVPRLSLPDRVRGWADRAAVRSNWLARISDSPVLVARRGP